MFNVVSLMTGFEQQTAGFESNHSAYLGSTTAQYCRTFYGVGKPISLLITERL